MKYLTLEEIKIQVRQDSSIDDRLLTDIGDAAEDATERAIGQPIDACLENGQVPPALRRAMLMLCSSYYDQPGAYLYGPYAPKDNPAYEALIGPFRTY